MVTVLDDNGTYSVPNAPGFVVDAISRSNFTEMMLTEEYGLNNVTQVPQNATNRTLHHGPRMGLMSGGEIRIPLYSIIFLLSVAGNSLVILTLVQNKRMRTVTNVFLLNLSVSDLLLAVFCMPFTLIPTLLRNFVFGQTMCILIRYLQGKHCLTAHTFCILYSVLK